MKNLVLIVFAFLFLGVNQAFAYRVTDFSTDAKIVEAVRVLEQAGETDVLRSLERRAVRIKFNNLSMVSYNSANAFAVSTTNEFGTKVIYINSIYRNAPAEQIACLIAHESCHTGYSATLEEETTATQKEAACWTRLKSAYKTYPDSKLTRRLDKLSGLYMASTSNNNLVEQKIASSSFYRSQLGLN